MGRIRKLLYICPIKKSVYTFRTKDQQLNWLQALFMFGRHQTIYIYYMKKEQIIRQCYGGMKEKHGMETVTLFHVGDSYEAYFEDAETITRIMEAPLFKMTAANIPAVRISDTAMEDCRNRLLDAGHEVCVSEFRGASGRHILKIL